MNTEAKSGPLYRVVGTPLIIPCSTSGFKDEDTVKDFQFRITKPSYPTFPINIISTNDPLYGFAKYQIRVQSNEITLKRVSPNSVVFEIQKLEKSDEGVFECSVINSEIGYYGTYNAKTDVKGN